MRSLKTWIEWPPPPIKTKVKAILSTTILVNMIGTIRIIKLCVSFYIVLFLAYPILGNATSSSSACARCKSEIWFYGLVGWWNLLQSLLDVGSVYTASLLTSTSNSELDAVVMALSYTLQLVSWVCLILLLASGAKSKIIQFLLR